MIARLIELCMRNRAATLLLTAALLAAGLWAQRTVNVDAIPDLSDVQVVIRTDYPGQAPQIVEDQITYPLTTAMLATSGADVVRGYSMFGTSFVYVIFEDGVDLHWARSRTLEQLSAVADRLPAGAAPQLGPDATGVGWVFQYMLITGRYCPDHPDGVWHDPMTQRWFASLDKAPEDRRIRARLAKHRVFPTWSDAREPAAGLMRCPVDGQPLREPDIDLAELRSLQDWRLRYELTAVEGVSEVASVGGFIKQYQVIVDPVRLLAFDMPLARVRRAIERSSLDVGGRVIEQAEAEYMVRSLGFLGALTDDEIARARANGQSIERLRSQRALEQLEAVALDADEQGRPIYVRDVARVQVGPDIRRGVAEWNGQGEAVGGIVVMRFGENARATIARVRARLTELESSLPPGVAVRVGYDRSGLIDRAVATLNRTLVEEIAVVSLVILLFLWHARSALVAVVVLPLGVLATLLVMRLAGVSANIMSLGGIAISIGVMVDSAIIMIENAHKRLEREGERRQAVAGPTLRMRIIADAAKEVGPSLFFALLIITVSFVPIFALTGESGRLFKPLALTKTVAMAAAALLAVTVIPALMTLLVTERVLPQAWPRAMRLGLHAMLVAGPAAALALAPLGELAPWRWWFVVGWAGLAAAALLPQRLGREERNPLNRVLRCAYEPFFALAMRFRWLTIALALAVVTVTVWPLRQLGSEFMPPLEEGDLLYMPTVDPGVSVTKARELLQQTNRLIMRFPEVKSAWGKAGRAETATDPAPISMIETTVALELDKLRWRRVAVPRFFDDWPEWLAAPLRTLWPESRPITLDELIYGYESDAGDHVPGLNDALRLPGVTNAWTMPIRTRIDMLSTGVRTPVGVKVMGDDLAALQQLAGEIAAALQTHEATSAHTASAYAEKSASGRYVDIEIDREALARYGLHVADAQLVVASALGGAEIAQTIEGRERYGVSLRYPRELRESPADLEQTLIASPSGAQIPLGLVAAARVRNGPPMIKSENARLTSWVYVDIAGIDVGTYIERAQRVVAERVQLPAGYTLVWSGAFERMREAREKLIVVGPVAIGIIVLLLYAATRSWLRVLLTLAALPFALVGAVWLLYLLDYNLSLAVWVGMIALAGLAAETGLVMLLYLDNSVARFRDEGRLRDANDLWWAVHDGAVRRIRPKTMTVLTVLVGLSPLLWAQGAGADTMRRLAAPMIGGVGTSFILELLIFPPVYYIAMRVAMRRGARALGGQPGTLSDPAM